MFYMAGNNPVTHQDVMGLYSGTPGDHQERIVEQDSVMVGRGRARMPAAVIEFVDHAFEIADILVSEAVVAMQETGRARRSIDQTLKQVFSNLDRRSELESRFQVLKTAIKLYRNGVRHDELAFVKSKKSSDSTLASVVGKDPLKRIFIRSRAWEDRSRRGLCYWRQLLFTKSAIWISKLKTTITTLRQGRDP